MQRLGVEGLREVLLDLLLEGAGYLRRVAAPLVGEADQRDPAVALVGAALQDLQATGPLGMLVVGDYVNQASPVAGIGFRGLPGVTAD
jgi:hypothetical protein